MKGHQMEDFGDFSPVSGFAANNCSAMDEWQWVTVDNVDKRRACLHAVSDGRKGGSPDGY